MKRFTLLELLIVIAVMAILIGLIGANLPAFMTNMRVTQTKKDLSNLALAVSAFQAEFNTLPVDEKSPESIDPNKKPTDLDRYRQLIGTLAGMNEYAGKPLNETEFKKLNYRKKSFWKIPPNYSKTDYDLKDPWGHYYVFWFDVDADGKTNKVTGSGNCLIWSYGPGVEDDEASGTHSISKISSTVESRAKARTLDRFIWNGEDGIIAGWIEKRNEDEN